MKSPQQIPLKIYTLDNLLKQLNAWRVLNKKIVFTSAVFDILRKEDIAYLNEAASCGDILIIGIVADESINVLKDAAPLVNDENARALLLASLLQTDAVIIFKEDEALELIKQIMPNVLVNNTAYTIEQITGAKQVLAFGGEIKMYNIAENLL
jgi:D-glycero-beta-D-manno-heptose 1-phosphate adenylyltransferase